MHSEVKIREIVEQLVGNSIEGVVALTPDASLRRYFRVLLRKHKYNSAIAMVFDSVACPEHSGGPKLGADECYVLLTQCFRAAGVSVPELYFDARDRGLLIIEDLGDRQLISAAEQPLPEIQVFEFYEQAVEQILLIQKMEGSSNNIAFQREFNSALYVKEMRECSDYLLEKATQDKKEIADFNNGLEYIGEKLYSLPKVVVHRDFHSWNLLIDHNEQVRVIDFQDALLATKYYDLVALLNDRDTDEVIGKEIYKELLSSFLQQLDGSNVAEYLLVLLQRDLKVSGRFEKLATERGLVNYKKWIPGTLRRVGQSLVTLVELTNDKQLLRMLDVLSQRLELVNVGKKMGVFDFVK